MMEDVGKIVRVISTSEKGFEDAISNGVKRFCSIRKGTRGAAVNGMTLKIKDGKITAYRVVLDISAEF